MFIYNPSQTTDQSAALWAACVQSLKHQVAQSQIDIWLNAVEPVSLIHTQTGEHTQLVLNCKTTQTQKINAILSQFQAVIEQNSAFLCGHPVEWVLLAARAANDFTHSIPSQTQSTHTDVYETDDLNADPAERPTHTSSATNRHASLNAPIDTTDQASLDGVHENQTIHQGTGLNSRLSFDRFVVGKANQMAHAAAQHVAAQPGASYNPLFLYGGVGLGKTHLAHAVGNVVMAQNPNARIRYIHANQFIADVVASYRRQTFDAFKRYYHGLDLLIIDDIQFFADKKRTQEELFYAFEALVANRSQIILTSDTYPKDLADMESRLVSRFSAGLITAIDPPELEMRVAILQEKAKTLSIALLDDVAFYIAKNLRSNVRELEGALHKLLAYSRFQNSHITLEMAKVALRDMISGPRGILSIDMIQKVVADYYKIKLSDLYGKRRLAGFVLPRQVAMYLSKEMTQKSLPDIGEAFGGRDHTTVLHAVRKINQEKTDNPQLKHQLHVIEQTLGA